MEAIRLFMWGYQGRFQTIKLATAMIIHIVGVGPIGADY